MLIKFNNSLLFIQTKQFKLNAYSIHIPLFTDSNYQYHNLKLINLESNVNPSSLYKSPSAFNFLLFFNLNNIQMHIKLEKFYSHVSPSFFNNNLSPFNIMPHNNYNDLFQLANSLFSYYLIF